MKLESIAIKGFRAFGKQARFEFGDTNIIGGPNGFGKTSLFDAVEWCLFGSVQRLAGSRDFTKAGDVVQSKFSREKCSVDMEFRDANGHPLSRARYPDTCKSEIDGRPVDDNTFLSRLGFEGDAGRSKFLRGVLLQQEKISEFVRELNPRSRYDAILSLLEFPLPGNLLELLDSLADRVETLKSEAGLRAREIQNRLNSTQEDVSKLRAANVENAAELLASRYRGLAARVFAEDPEAVAREDPTAEQPTATRLKELSKGTQERLREWRTILDKCTELRRTAREGTPEASKQNLTDSLREEQAAAASLREQAERSSLETREAEATANELKVRVDESERSADRLRSTLAGIRQFVNSDQCPVCKRPIPRAALIETIDKELGQTAAPLSNLLTEAREAEAKLAHLRSGSDDIKRQLRERELRISELKERIEHRAQFDSLFTELKSGKLPEARGMTDLAFEAFVDKAAAQVDRLTSLSEEAIRTMGLLDQLNAGLLLPGKLEELSLAASDAEKAANRQKTLEDLGAALRRLREAIIRGRAESVAAFLESYRPLVALFYERLDPHPLFSAIDIEIQRAYKEWELYFRVFNSDRSVSAYPPAVFSTSQLNALALCVFLTLNIRTKSPFAAVMMDDPVQLMDDLNVLGFCDLIRQMKGKKQIFISTHDQTLYELLLSKLRPTDRGEVVKGFRLEAWSEDGPTIAEHEVDFKKCETTLDEIRRLAAS